MMNKVVIDRDEMENVEWQDLHSQPHKTTPAGKRRLLITTDNFLPRWDGISRFLSEVIPRLKVDYDITVICPDYGQVTIEDVEIVRIPLSKRRLGDYTPAKYEYAKIARYVRRADIVFNQALGPIGVASILAAKSSRRPIASYIHSIEWELAPKALTSLGPLRALAVPFSRVFARLLYNRCTILIVPSENIAELFTWQRIRTPKRIAHLGVDMTKFQSGEKMKARAALNLPEDAFIVGYHGRVAHEKNLLTLLRAFRRLQVKNKRLIIVGDGVPEIKAKLTKHHDVMVTGSTNHVTPWLQAMDVYVQPSLTETTSLTVLEAMACGLPVVSSRVGFIKYYIKDHENGLLFDNQSPYDLFLKIKLLHDDRILRSKLSINARKTVHGDFNWEKTAKEIKALLDGI